MDFESFKVGELTFTYSAYVGVCISGIDNPQKFTGWSSTPPYCFNHLTKSQAADLLDQLREIVSGDFTRNQKDILFSVIRECKKVS